MRVRKLIPTEEAVEIITPLADQLVKAFPANVTFECEFNKAKLNVTWLKNGRPLEPSKRYKSDSRGTKYTLTISDVNDEDHAEFTVSFQGVGSSAKLKVEGENTQR